VDKTITSVVLGFFFVEAIVVCLVVVAQAVTASKAAQGSKAVKEPQAGKKARHIYTTVHHRASHIKQQPHSNPPPHTQVLRAHTLPRQIADKKMQRKESATKSRQTATKSWHPVVKLRPDPLINPEPCQLRNPPALPHLGSSRLLICCRGHDSAFKTAKMLSVAISDRLTLLIH